MLFLRHCSPSTALMCLRVSEEEVLGIVLEETNGSVGENTGLSSQSSKSRFYCPKERAGLWLRVGMCNLDDNVQLRCVAKVCS